MDESYDNENNERIYESIAECFQNNRNTESSSRMEATSSSINGKGFQHGANLNACYGFTMPISSATAKKAFKTSADKFVDTMNSVCTKFGTLSQRLRRSTRRRAPLINSPGTPMRPPLGRTPTKMYSPFSIETPRGKENSTARRSLNRDSFKKVTPPKSRGFSIRRKIHVEEIVTGRSSPRLTSDMQEAQIGVFEFHRTADNILKNLQR